MSYNSIKKSENEKMQKPGETLPDRHVYNPLTPEMWDQIVDDIATTEQSLHTLCKKYNVNLLTLYRHKKSNTQMQKDFADAKELQADLMAENILAIADDCTLDCLMEDKYGNRIENREFTKRSELRVKTRRDLMRSMAPKTYGDKIVPSAGSNDDLQVEWDILDGLYTALDNGGTNES
jgi:hypothetical protein